ncbi:MAG: hypothetical protein ABIS84_04780 [Arachnia sp.]
MSKADDLDVLAPSVDATWRDDFVMELRLQGVTGRAIADALVEVEAHCGESGTSARDAFGSAVAYAKALELPDASPWTGRQLARTWVQLLLVTGGAWLILEGGIAQVLGTAAQINLASVVSALATVIAMALVFAFGERLLRFVVEHVVLAGAGFALVLAALVALGLPFRGVVLGSLPAAWVLGGGVAALVAFAVYTLHLRRSGKSLEDPLLAPVPRPVHEV